MVNVTNNKCGACEPEKILGPLCFVRKTIATGALFAASSSEPMTAKTVTQDYPIGKPICVGLTCWRWQRGRVRDIDQLAQRLGVKMQLTQRGRGLRRYIDCQVSGRNVDQFIGEFVRHC